MYAPRTISKTVRYHIPNRRGKGEIAMSNIPRRNMETMEANSPFMP